MLICFVIMPFGETSPEHTEDYWTTHFEHFIKQAVQRAMFEGKVLGYQAEIIRQQPGSIPINVFKKLQHADVVLADLTDANPNVLYELGICHTMGRPTILIIEEGQEIPFYFKAYNVITYSKKWADDSYKFNTEIEKRLAEIQQTHIVLASDNPVAGFLSATNQQVVTLEENEVAVIKAMRDHHVSALYTPENNSRRTAHKSEVIKDSKKTIKLLAHTGHSYLASFGHRFKDELTNRLENGVSIKVLLLNPWTEAGLMIALAELTPNRFNQMTEIQRTVSEKLKAGELKGFDPVALIESSPLYKKHMQARKGYEDDFEQIDVLENIDLRFCEFEIAATILLTETSGFFEPYIHVNLQERQRALMLTFELEFSSASYLAHHTNDYFDQLWKISMPYQKFITEEERFKMVLRQKYV